MDTQTTEQQVGGSPYKDTVLLIAAVVLLAAGLWAFYQFDKDYNTLIRTLGLLAAMGAALAVTYQTEMGKAMWATMQGANVERRKVVWPTKQESIQATLMIAVIVVIFALILGGIDWLLNLGVKALTSGKGV